MVLSWCMRVSCAELPYVAPMIPLHLWLPKIEATAVLDDSGGGIGLCRRCFHETELKRSVCRQLGVHGIYPCAITVGRRDLNRRHF